VFDVYKGSKSQDNIYLQVSLSAAGFYLWDEIMIPVTYDSDWRRAVEIILAKVEELTAAFHAGARAEFAEMVKKYPSLP